MSDNDIKTAMEIAVSVGQLKERFEKLEQERDDWYDNFERSQRDLAAANALAAGLKEALRNYLNVLDAINGESEANLTDLSAAAFSCEEDLRAALAKADAGSTAQPEGRKAEMRPHDQRGEL